LLGGEEARVILRRAGRGQAADLGKLLDDCGGLERRHGCRVEALLDIGGCRRRDDEPVQLSEVTFGSFASAVVGTSPSAGARVALVTASAFSLPLLMCPSRIGTSKIPICTCPPRRSLTAGAAPLYGTWTKSTFASALNSSPARCVMLPPPAEP